MLLYLLRSLFSSGLKQCAGEHCIGISGRHESITPRAFWARQTTPLLSPSPIFRWAEDAQVVPCDTSPALCQPPQLSALSQGQFDEQYSKLIVLSKAVETKHGRCKYSNSYCRIAIFALFATGSMSVFQTCLSSRHFQDIHPAYGLKHLTGSNCMSSTRSSWMDGAAYLHAAKRLACKSLDAVLGHSGCVLLHVSTGLDQHSLTAIGLKGVPCCAQTRLIGNLAECLTWCRVMAAF